MSDDRFKELFKQLDINNDGEICVNDLKEALKRKKILLIKDHAEKLLNQADSTGDRKISYPEFKAWATKHEANLNQIFTKLDINKDGRLSKLEIIKSLKDLRIPIKSHEIDQLWHKIEKDKIVHIDCEQWLDNLFLQPNTDIESILQYWKHSLLIDIGESGAIPDDFTTQELVTGAWWRHLIAGAAAGAMSRTATAPLDRIKVLLQVYANQTNNMGIVSGAKQLITEGGIKGMWRGNGINVAKIAPETAIKFMAYDQIKKLLKAHNESKELSITDRFLAGSLAGVMAQSIIYPLEVLKTRLTLRKTGEFKNAFDAVRNILALEGWRSFYRGFAVNMLGIIPYAGIDLAVYETLKNFLRTRYMNNEEAGIMVMLTCGTVSSSCGQMAAYPFALVRTKLQATRVEISKQRSFVDIFLGIWRSEGIYGLYRGITPNFLKVAPAVSISYVVFEYTKRLLDKQQKYS